jgi:hypothetical protein
MSIYYMSACHDCKEWVMWAKCPESQAEKWHKDFHRGHRTELSNDYDDEFYDKLISDYKKLGIQP